MRSRGAFLYTNLGFSRRRFIYALMINSVAAIEVAAMDSELARGRVSKFYWLVALGSQAWVLVSLFV